VSGDEPSDSPGQELGAIAAIDIGTNSIHTVLARALDQGRYEVLTREKATVRLGSGGGDMDTLDDDAIDRGIAALARAAQLAADRNALVVAVATSAVREASNRSVFIRRASEEAGVSVEVISGVEEARLIHLGVLGALPVFDRPHALIDIGGGSTEVLYGTGDEVAASRSFKLGAIRTTRRFFPDGLFGEGSEKSRSRQLRAARAHVASALAPFATAVADLPFEVIAGCSGTIETLAAMARAKAGENGRSANGSMMTRKELDAVVDAILGAASAEELKALPGMESSRADIIVGGALIVQGAMEAFGWERLTISEGSLREGVLQEAQARLTGGDTAHLADLRRHSVEHLLIAADEDPDHARCIARLSLEIFDGLERVHGLGAEHRELLEAGALLANVGLMISHSAHHKHNYYIVRNTDRLSGFNDREIELVAQLARFHRKARPDEQRHPEFGALSLVDRAVVRTLAGILRVAVGLDRSHANKVGDVEVLVSADEVSLVANPAEAGDDIDLELYAGSANTNLLAEVLGRSVSVTGPAPSAD
jgi:exopolyphosphatase/guanosine-5'-triphosphate,3'-diphosphate pyrophosphatase